MKIRNINIQLEEYENQSDLPQTDQQLLNLAAEALNGSYAPYSEFHVGAAALLDNGEMIQGSNQENAAYPSGLCAERVALFHAKHQYPESVVKSVAITARADHFSIDHPITPCGACRQVIAEVQNRQHEKIRIILKGQTGPVQVIHGIEHLLPLMFREEKLKRSKSKK
jgi:cytidine deaminase